jgi:23S rRNA (uridine2552-2'-O)-methyltransferase
MMPIDGVYFLQGDFREDETLARLAAALGEHQVDLVISDMAPNISGIAAVDQPRSMYLGELALEYADAVLGRQGSLLVKVFQGEGFDDFLKALRTRFDRVVTRKPAASRDRSREVYLVARNYDP